MEYESKGLDPGTKVCYLLNGIRHDKLFTAVVTVKAHPKKILDFNAVVFLSHTVH